MFRLPRFARFAAAGALAVSSFSLFAASPASAASTLSFADDGNGGVVVTYTYDGTNMVAVEFYPQGTTCQVNAGGALMVLTYPGGPPGSELAASPTTLTFGTPVWQITPTAEASTIPAGSYTLCGASLGGMQSQILDQIAFTFSSEPVSTTTSTSSTSTTTTAVADPAVPAYTG